MNPFSSPTPAVALLSLLPLFIAMGTVALIILLMAPRKGKSRAWALLGLLPLANMVVLIWIASLTDKAVLDALAELKKKKCLTSHQSQCR
jgi:cell division inhibitor SulA